MSQVEMERHPSRFRWLRWIAPRLGLSLLGVLFAVVLFEGFIRAAWAFAGRGGSSHNIDSYCTPTEVVSLRPGENFTGFYQFDELLARRWVPGARGIRNHDEEGTPVVYEANEHGWRDISHTQEKPPGTFRIAVIGDSFGVAHGRPLNEAIARQLEAWLNNAQRLDQHIEVVNLSMAGNTPVEYSLILRHEAPRFDPDLIVILLFTYNDVRADLPGKTTVVDGHIRYTQEHLDYYRQLYTASISGPGAGLTWDELEAARDEGRLIVAEETEDGVRSYQVRLAEPIDVPPGQEFPCFLDRNLRSYTFLKVKMRNVVEGRAVNGVIATGMATYQASPDEATAAAWQLYEDLLVQMADDAAAQATPIAFVTLANGDQVYPELFANGLATLWYSPDNYDANYPIDRTEALCEQHDMICWWLLPAFRDAAANSDEQLFGGYDPQSFVRTYWWGHYTAFGDALAARTIGGHILEQDWIAPQP